MLDVALAFPDALSFAKNFDDCEHDFSAKLPECVFCPSRDQEQSEMATPWEGSTLQIDQALVHNGKARPR